MDEKKLMVVGGVVGAAALVAFAAYEYMKKPTSSTVTTTTTTTPGSNAAQTYAVLPGPVARTVNMHVGDTLAIQIAGAASSGYVYAFTNGTMPGWAQGATGISTATTGGVSVMTVPFTATAKGTTTFTLALFPSSDGVNINAGASAVSGSQVSVTANVT